MDRILTEILYIAPQVLKVLLIKSYEIQSLDLLFLVALLAFTSADICQKFLELEHSKLSAKKFCPKFSFFNAEADTKKQICLGKSLKGCTGKLTDSIIKNDHMINCVVFLSDLNIAKQAVLFDSGQHGF